MLKKKPMVEEADLSKPVLFGDRTAI